jgi:hypothetical protein
MTYIDQLILWQKIQAFEFDLPGATLSLSARLARDNNWKHDFALRVLAEYKKFVFLCCIGDKEITPSDTVDQAWHLHLLYTRSYWEDFCRDTLGMPLHHGPTKGGKQEKERFSGGYDRTFDRYRAFFNSEPPADIWQDNTTRFKDIDFVRVNRRTHWIVPKPDLSTLHGIPFKRLALLLLTLPFFYGCKNGGALFLGFFALTMVAMVAAAATNTPKTGTKNDAGGGCSAGCSSSSHGDSGCGSDGGGDGGGGCSSGCGGCGGGCGGG